MGIGKDLLDIPFAELVRNLAIAIADGQTALDRNSLETLQALADMEAPVITDITEVIESYERPVKVTVKNPSGGGTHEETIMVTGARVNAASNPAVKATMNMLQAGLSPTFYQFTEASIEVHLSITMKEDREASPTKTSPVLKNTSRFLGLGASRAYASSVDYRSASKYNYQASGSSVLKATLKPVPPPSRLEPAVTTINMLTSPPTITKTG